MPYKISGILFDDEVGDPSCIVKAMEYAKQNIRHKTEVLRGKYEKGSIRM